MSCGFCFRAILGPIFWRPPKIESLREKKRIRNMVRTSRMTSVEQSMSVLHIETCNFHIYEPKIWHLWSDLCCWYKSILSETVDVFTFIHTHYITDIRRWRRKSLRGILGRCETDESGASWEHRLIYGCLYRKGQSSFSHKVRYKAFGINSSSFNDVTSTPPARINNKNILTLFIVPSRVSKLSCVTFYDQYNTTKHSNSW